MLKTLRSCLLIAVACLCVPAWSVIEIEPLSRAELEARYRVLLEEMRCPKCQNQNLKDSNSPISVDLRREIRRMLEEGYSDEEITAYLVDRYGEFVRYRPAVKGNTLMLWFGPGLLLLVGLGVAVVIVRRQRRVAVPAASHLNDDEQRKLDDLFHHRPTKDKTP